MTSLPVATPELVNGNHPTPGARPHRILVVAGDRLYRGLLAAALERAGWEVHAVDTADAAVEAFETGSYAMVIVETDGAPLDGYAVSRQLRQVKTSGAHVPIVAFTNDTLQSDRKKRKAAGIDNYIGKPLRSRSLDNLLRRYAEAEGPPDGAGSQLGAIDERCVADLLEMVGDTSQFKIFLQNCVTDIGHLMDQLREAEEDNDLGLLWEAARLLKGRGAQLGIGRVQAIAATIETLARAGSAAGVDALLQELSIANEQGLRELRSFKPVLERPVRKRQDAPAAPGHVLVAESDALTERFLVTLLTNNGFTPTCAVEGNAALARVESKVFQLVVANMNLPGLDGLGLLARCRLRPEYERVPVILLSSRGVQQDVVRAFELGADDHVSLPFNPMELLARIQRLLRTR